MLLDSDASGSEFIHFQNKSNRKVLILNSHASALELFQLQYNSYRNVSILDSHASQPLNLLFVNAILKETQSSIRLRIDDVSMQVLTVMSQKIFDSGPSRLRLSIDGFAIESDRKSLILESHASRPEFIHFRYNSYGKTYWFCTVTPQAQSWFIFNTILLERHWFWTVTPQH